MSEFATFFVVFLPPFTICVCVRAISISYRLDSDWNWSLRYMVISEPLRECYLANGRPLRGSITKFVDRMLFEVKRRFFFFGLPTLIFGLLPLEKPT